MIEPDGQEHICERCGECCVMGSPTLHLSDFKLFEDNIISLNDVYTLRKGELVYDNVGEDLDYLKEEMIKIKESSNSKTCVFYDPAGQSCRIYATRPLQCVYFECWNPKEFFKTLDEEKLARNDLFHQVPALKEIIHAHEERCSYEKLAHLFKKTQGGSREAAEEILDILQYDSNVRPLICEELNISQESLDLIFGRPLTTTITMYGYKVERDAEDSYCLVMDEEFKRED